MGSKPGVIPSSISADEGSGMRTRTLLSQVLAVNTALVAATAIVAARARARAGIAATPSRAVRASCSPWPPPCC